MNNKENHKIFESYQQINELIGGLQYGDPISKPPTGGTVDKIKDKYRSGKSKLASTKVGQKAAAVTGSAAWKTGKDIAKAAVNKVGEIIGQDYGYLDTGEQLEDFASKLFGAHEWNAWIKTNLLQDDLEFDGDVIIYRSAVMSRRKAPAGSVTGAIAFEHEKMPQLFQYLLTWKKKYDTVYHVNGDDLGDGWQAQGGGWRGNIEVKMKSPNQADWPAVEAIKLRRALHLITKLFTTDGKIASGASSIDDTEIEDKEQAVLDHNGGITAATDESGNAIDLATKLPSPFGFSGNEEMKSSDTARVLLGNLYDKIKGASSRDEIIKDLKPLYQGSDNGVNDPPYDILSLREIAGMEPFMGADKNGFPWPTEDYDESGAIGRNPVEPAGVSAHFIKLTKDLSSLSANEQRDQILFRLAKGAPGETVNFRKEDPIYSYMMELITAKLNAGTRGRTR